MGNDARPPRAIIAAQQAVRVLIVEDSPTNRLRLKHVLEGRGHTTREVSDGSEALDAAREFAPHVILMDVVMPRMDGFEACRLLKADEQLAGIPVIFLTALDEKDTTIRAFDAGAVDFVAKPFEDREVLARVSAHAELYLSRQKLQEYARQLKEELVRTAEDEEAGRQVQFKLLPKDGMRFGPCEFHRLLMPSMHMSGDFVDYFRIDEHRTGFYILDVSGHGAASAFVTVLVKSFVSHALSQHQNGTDDAILDPARLLSQLNKELLNGGLEKHAVMFYAVLDKDGREMRYANGGHFPFPVLTGGSSSHPVASRSPPVGLFDVAAYTNDALLLPAEFSLLIFSDGVLDILPEAKLSDKVARLEAMAGAGITSLPDISNALRLDDVRELPDDVTILTLTRRVI